ncbi:MAG: hypothetical protein VKS61_07305 [Candidatus Sericytochromatia bacterium]|nr:hypothetical protein [Candidatus Sericytochromatia bacterium]
MRHVGSALCLSLLLAACSQPPAATPPAPSLGAAPAASQAPLTAPVAGRVQVVGQLRIPAGLALASSAKLVSERAAGLIANNAGGLVSNNVGGLLGLGADGRLARPAFRLQQLQTAGVEGARVYVADQAGNPIPGIPEVRSDGEARFTLGQVPAEEVFVIVAEVPTAGGKPALFRTIVQVGKFGATTTVDPPSTLVAFHVLDGLPAGALGNFNPAKFQTASEATGRNLTADKLPDFTDVLAIKAKMAELVALVQELRELLVDVRKDLAEIKSSLDALRASPPAGQPQASPAPAASGVPAATAAPASSAPVMLPSAATPVTPVATAPASPSPGAAPSTVASAPAVLPSVAASAPAASVAPSIAPSPSPTAALGCGGARTSHTFAVGNPTIQRLGVAIFNPMNPFDEGAIFASGAVSGGMVKLSVPEGCQLQFFIDFGPGWMPERTTTVPEGSGGATLPF